MFRLVLVCALVAYASACTTLIAGKDATVDGSVMCTHSNDGEGDTDPRMVRIPARDYAAGSMRPVYFAPESYPRYVGSDRKADAYLPVGKQEVMKPIGQIPQVAHTYSFFEDTYGAINEHQVGIGESTCSGIYGTKPAGHGGKAMLSVDTLSQIAMERCDSSRCAVTTMGQLAEKYGFYGAGSFEGTAESLMVTDPKEGFIFHILPDPNGTSAVWAALRVPDDHVGVVPNVFVIREVNTTDTHNFLHSTNMHSIAMEKGLWDGEGMLDFTATYSDGEYAHKFYSGRRVWGAYNILAPSAKLSPDYEEWKKSAPYPSTIKPDQKVSVETFVHVMRSYYEGTQFDQTKGSWMAGGPWGNPDHVASDSKKVHGNWERTIGLFRTSDSYIVQSRSWLPNSVGGVIWWGPHAAPYTMYVPYAAGMTKLPAATLGFQSTLNKGAQYWAQRYLATMVQTKFSYMIDDVHALQSKVHNMSLAVQAECDKLKANDPTITTKYNANAEAVLALTWKLIDDLHFKYADGWLNEVKPDGSFESSRTPYPDWWFKAVNYTNGPPPCPGGECARFNGEAASVDAIASPNCTADAVITCVRQCNKDDMAVYTKCVDECVGTC